MHKPEGQNQIKKLWKFWEEPISHDKDCTENDRVLTKIIEERQTESHEQTETYGYTCEKQGHLICHLLFFKKSGM
jgi:hypothetical protein